MTDQSILDRLDRLESLQEIQELAHRYAMAVDARDIDTFLGLYIEDVDCGRRGKGREALRSYVVPAVQNFYRSVHQICGQVVDVLDGDHATGRVYGRCEHECGDAWIVQANCYFDTYARRDGRWYFVKRDEDFFFSCDIKERPQEAGFERWPGLIPRHRYNMMLERHPSWAAFWRDTPPEVLAKITRAPGRVPGGSNT